MNKFKEFLQEKNIKQKDLAAHLGVNQSLISQWCTDRCKPSISVVPDIAKYAKVSVSVILKCFENHKRRKS